MKNKINLDDLDPKEIESLIEQGKAIAIAKRSVHLYAERGFHEGHVFTAYDFRNWCRRLGERWRECIKIEWVDEN